MVPHDPIDIPPKPRQPSVSALVVLRDMRLAAGLDAVDPVAR
jgi:hypothetical protein